MNPSLITDMASAFYQSSILFTASDAGIFDYLAAHPLSDVYSIAHAVHFDVRAATLLLDACVALRLLEKKETTYQNSPESALFLVSGSPADLSRAIRYNRDVYHVWGQLGAFAQSGQPVENPQIHLGGDADRTRTFVLSMHGRAMGIGQSVIPLLDLEGCRTLFDVGGGPGTYAVLLARKWPELHCTVMDLPDIVAVADELIASAGLSDRVQTQAGDYHTTAFPENIDVCLFFGMLHQESPQTIRDLMKKAYAALRPGGKIVVLDMMTDATHTQPAFSALFALNMALTATNGWVFSDAELEQWVTDAGLIGFSCRPLPPPMPHWLATAHKPTSCGAADGEDHHADLAGGERAAGGSV